MRFSQTSELPAWRPAAARLEPKPAYKLAELLRFDDADFIEVAYQTLLHRAPDNVGLEGYLIALRSGSAGKVEILGAIRFSEEGRRCGVHVDGLLLPYKLHQWRHRRLIGPLIGFVIGVVRLPRLAMRLQSIETNAAQESQCLGAAVNRLAAAIDVRMTGLDQQIGERMTDLDQRHQVAMQSAIAEGFAAFERSLLAEQRRSADLVRASTLASVEGSAPVDHGHRKPGVDPVAFRDAMMDVLDPARVLSSPPPVAEADTRVPADRAGFTVSRALEIRAAMLSRRIGVVEEVARSQLDMTRIELLRHVDRELKERVAAVQAALDEREPSRNLRHDTFPRALDSFYVALEDRFRGSSELIAKRCEVYVPVIQKAVERTHGGLVLDIGCGRGEWLRILGKHGFEARGVDLNETMVLECRAAGLNVQEADAMAHLSGLADASVAAVTGMHIIEHIPFSSVVQLFDQVLRVLKPGGVVVFETPNPENMDVGACSFYMDPTHLHPLPPPLTEYTASMRGFDEVEICRLSEYRPVPVPPTIQDPRLPGGEALQWLLDRLRERLSIAPDYAVIAWKGPLP